jgi:transglutaminase-like putative cysteine protease
MVRIDIALELNYQVLAPGCDFIFHVHAAQTRHQRVVGERLQINQAVLQNQHLDLATGNRSLRLSALPGPLTLAYDATVEVAHHVAPPESIGEVPVARLPAHVLPYVYPSRYCQSDRLGRLAIREFGGLWQGYGRVLAIRDWVQRRVAFQSNTTDANTSAVDTLIEEVGVCRDFAHLMIALCRALSIPARFITGFDFGADPALGPPDFHAYVEVWLGDRWYLFDPSGTAIPMGLVRLAVGRDAADVAFAMIFGSVQSQPPAIRLTAQTDARHHVEWPRHRAEALSTDSGRLDEVLLPT